MNTKIKLNLKPFVLFVSRYEIYIALEWLEQILDEKGNVKMVCMFRPKFPSCGEQK